MANFDRASWRLGTCALPVCERYEIAVVRVADLGDRGRQWSERTRVLLAVAASSDGQQDFLGLWPASLDAEQTWQSLWGELAERGLLAVKHVILVDTAGVACKSVRDCALAAMRSNPELAGWLSTELDGLRQFDALPSGPGRAWNRCSTNADRDFEHLVGRASVQRLLSTGAHLVAAVGRACRNTASLDQVACLEAWVHAEFHRLDRRPRPVRPCRQAGVLKQAVPTAALMPPAFGSVSRAGLVN